VVTDGRPIFLPASPRVQLKQKRSLSGRCVSWPGYERTFCILRSCPWSHDRTGRQHSKGKVEHWVSQPAKALLFDLANGMGCGGELGNIQKIELTRVLIPK
jgi:hypothetical protein